MSLKNRFIPAGAGNSDFGGGGDWGNTVYPRWRGELYQTGIAPYNGGGLSPLARGTPTRRHGQSLRQRFIPAGAGNSTQNGAGQNRSTVYPRWRGELGEYCGRRCGNCGLSPLARGTL
ncbi:Domain of uncharacterised function (DUF2825) [Escherichia coli]|nr:Domain of uncharacterised function (DUF2825) [Escherichia coli]